ncbi:cytochrome c [Arenibaculum sp.]|jgi:mono/diheme cytochrome c family protein|uniref:c-type cytochrome n=1 Tax=Arenibaculum sp. TaxID=2865862 RepID=UPI002E0F7531|nr:cytochrome c [Arenibaculum sp.]
MPARSTVRKAFLFVVGLAALGAAGGLAFVYSGIYDISAIAQHTRPVYWIFDVALRRSVAIRAPEAVPVDLDDPELLETGFDHYQVHCVQCHGAPGVAPQPFALGMTPLPANLAHSARNWSPEEIFWIVENGVKMSGMPAWKFRMSPEEMWAVTAFVMHLPTIAPVRYRAMVEQGGLAGPQPAPQLSSRWGAP